MRLLVASRNAKKLDELQRILDAAGVAGVELVGLDEVAPYDEAPETAPDFEGNALNRGAAEWIYPDEDTDPAEPWVFLVDGDGTVLERWDNVANSDDVAAAVDAAVA